MEVILPITEHTVTIYDHVPQRVVEILQELNEQYSGKIDIVRYQTIGLDDIAEELGIQRAEEIRNADKSAYDQLMHEARLEIVRGESTDVIGVKEANAMGREQNANMIKRIRDKNSNVVYDRYDEKFRDWNLKEWLSDLPSIDYLTLTNKISKNVRGEQEELGKAGGLSNASSQESPSIALETKKEPETLSGGTN